MLDKIEYCYYEGGVTHIGYDRIPSWLKIKSYSFCELKPHAKFQNPRTTPSWRKVTQGEREIERERERMRQKDI